MSKQFVSTGMVVAVDKDGDALAAGGEKAVGPHHPPFIFTDLGEEHMLDLFPHAVAMRRVTVTYTVEDEHED